MPIIATNKYAFHEYEILERYEAGIVLSGQEVKSVRAGAVNLKAAYAAFSGGNLALLNASIPPYPSAGPIPSYDPTRSRRLLLNQRELEKIRGKLEVKGLTLVALKVYTAKSRIKVEIGLGRGKKQYEKRELLKKRSIEKELRESLKR